MGTHHVINNTFPLAQQTAALELGAPAFVFSTTQTDQHLETIAELIAPQGRFGLIDDPVTLNINRFKRKSVFVHWEFIVPSHGENRRCSVGTNHSTQAPYSTFPKAGIKTVLLRIDA